MRENSNASCNAKSPHYVNLCSIFPSRWFSPLLQISFTPSSINIRADRPLQKALEFHYQYSAVFDIWSAHQSGDAVESKERADLTGRTYPAHLIQGAIDFIVIQYEQCMDAADLAAKCIISYEKGDLQII